LEVLAEEAKTRPHLAPSAEEVLAVLGHDGVKVAESKQVLARIVGARYCLAGTTAAGLAVSVCEYADAAAASAGRARSLEAFKMIHNRDIYLRGPITLTLVRPSPAGPPVDESRRAARTLAGL
jgi:hypothetical protein